MGAKRITKSLPVAKISLDFGGIIADKGTMNTKRKTNGTALREAREAAGMTQSGIANRLCVSPRVVSDWEAGNANFFPHMWPLAAILDVDPLSFILDPNLPGAIQQPVKTSRRRADASTSHGRNQARRPSRKTTGGDS